MLEAFFNIHSDKSKAKEMQRSLHNGRKSLQSKNRSPQNCQKLAKGPSKKKKKSVPTGKQTRLRANLLIAVARGRPNQLKKPSK